MDLRPEDLETLQRVRTVSIQQRPHKVTVTDFIDVHAWRSRGTSSSILPER